MNNYFYKTIQRLLVCLIVVFNCANGFAIPLSPFQAKSDQVLVLYNSDWTKDVDGSTPGQDSREVAEYYQKMHTDPVTGKKPFLLGLKCAHGAKHLNQWKISEKSQDNKNGIVFIGEGKGPKKDEWARDSRKVEIVLNTKNNQEVDWDSVLFLCRSLDGKEKKVSDIVITGIPKKKGRQNIYPDIEAGKGRCYRFDAHKLARGNVRILVTAKNKAGKSIKNLRLKYYDRDDFKFSKFGPDGIVDEKHFQEDVAIPVKAFLENPENAISDGTLLKNHILYMVVCHGLPYSSEGVFGIERGVTSWSNNHGDLGSLEQRLQTLYYGWGTQIVPPVISMYMWPWPDSKKGVKSYRITSALRIPITGKRWNPYMHPDTYSFLSGKKKAEFIKLEPFQIERNKQPSFFFAYGVSRIDGQGPMESKRIVDYSIYASKYLRPEMQNKTMNVNLSENLKKAEKENLWGGTELSSLGFIPINKSSTAGIPFLKIKKPNSKSSNKKNQKPEYAGYYPGGMDFHVSSNNGWNRGRHESIWRQVDQGVTVSACGGPAYGGGPHITNATFWDNRILMRYLFRGRDLGECFLRSTLYVNWSTSLIGDPLYHPDLNKTIIDRTPPEVDSSKISVSVVPAMGKYAGIMNVPVLHNKNNPEVCRLTVFYSKKDSEIEKEGSWPIFSTKPYVYLRDLEPDSVYTYRILLTDPYGNKSIFPNKAGGLSFKTGPEIEKKVQSRKAVKRDKNWKVNMLKLLDFKEHGTVTIDFLAGAQGLFPSIKSGDMYLDALKNSDKKKININLRLGCPSKTWSIKSPLKRGEKASIIIRWRRFPLTREVILKAANGSEFAILTDIRTPWKKMKLKTSVKILGNADVKILSGHILNDALPASPLAFSIGVPPVDVEKWEQANNIK